MGKSGILAMILLSVLVLLVGVGAVACSGNGDENEAPPVEVEMELTSAAFQDRGTMPSRHTCDGQDISPTLSWSGVPAGTQSFAVILDDPDVPAGAFTHWVIFNIPADMLELEEAIPDSPQLANGAQQGENGFGSVGYRGPCPPSGASHHYHFTIYALDITLELTASVTKAQLLNAMQGHVLAQGELVAVYQH